MKNRNKNEKQYIRYNSMLQDRRVIDAIASAYNSIHLLEFDKDQYTEIQAIPEIHEYGGSKGKMSERFIEVISKLAPENTKGFAGDQLVGDAIQKRLKDQDYAEFDFQGIFHRWIRASFWVLNRDLRGRPKKVLFATRDINAEPNAQRDFEKEMPVAYACFRAIYDETGTNIIDMEYEYVNDKYCEWSQKTSNELVGYSFYEVFPDGMKSWLQYCYRAVELGENCYDRIYSQENGIWLSLNCCASHTPGCCVFAFMNAEKEQKEYEASDAIIRCTTILNTEREYETAMQEMLETFGMVIHAERVLLMEASKNMVVTRFAWPHELMEGDDKLPVYSMHYLLKMRDFLNSHESLNCCDVEMVKQFDEEMYENLKVKHVRNVAVEILYDNKRPIGLLVVENYKENNLVNIRKILNKISYFIAFRIANNTLMNELDSLGNRDALTGLYNRHGIDRYMDLYVYNNMSQPCTLIMIDLDNFKFVNDMYGHLCGDEVLTTVAARLRELFPEEAMVARNGGDEFVVLMQNSHIEDAKPYVEELVKTPNEFHFHEGECHVTVSVGYAEYPRHANSINELFNLADEALYQVKMHGKNGACIYEKGMESIIRSSLGFSLEDIGLNIPGALLIHESGYDGKLLYASEEAIALYECEDFEDLVRCCNGAAYNMIVDGDREELLEDLKKRETAGIFEPKVYKRYRIRTKNGNLKRVFDVSRIKNTEYHGMVAYVLLIEDEIEEDQA